MARRPRTPQPHHAPTTPETIQAFVVWINEMRAAYFTKTGSSLTPDLIEAQDPGRVNTKLVEMRDGRPASVFCFIENATGAVMKAASFASPEPKRYERGNIHKADEWSKWIEWTGPAYVN